MKNALIAAFVVLTGFMVGCAPTVDTPNEAVTLITKSAGRVQDSARYYSLNLSCGCPFPLKIEAIDTTQGVIYEYPDVGDTISIHTVRAKAKSGLTSGTHIGYMALVTIPPTVETLRDTLRDTLIVP